MDADDPVISEQPSVFREITPEENQRDFDRYIRPFAITEEQAARTPNITGLYPATEWKQRVETSRLEHEQSSLWANERLSSQRLRERLNPDSAR